MDVLIDDALLSQSLAAFRKSKIQLAEAPEFIQRLTSFLEIEVGKSATFIGQIKAIPEGKVEWFKDEEQLFEDSKHLFECINHTGLLKLTILHLNRKDEGAYKCRVENKEGVATTTGYLSVIASKNRGKKSSKRKGGAERVSSPPLLNSIVEQRSVEESEEREYKKMSPSPLHEFLSSIRHSAKNMAGPIVYGALENFNDILDLESLTDDEEVFEVTKKSRRSSDEDDFSTGESSSSEAEIARTPTDPSIPQIFVLPSTRDAQISKFTPVKVHTAAKRRQHNGPMSTDDSGAVALGSTAPSATGLSSNRIKISSTTRPVVQQNGTNSFVERSHRARFSEPDSNQRVKGSSFAQNSISSESRPLVLAPNFTLVEAKVHSREHPVGNRAIPLVDWNNMEVLGIFYFAVCFIALSTFLSVTFSISPRDVILIVSVSSAIFFLKTSTAGQE